MIYTKVTKKFAIATSHLTPYPYKNHNDMTSQFCEENPLFAVLFPKQSYMRQEVVGRVEIFSGHLVAFRDVVRDGEALKQASPYYGLLYEGVISRNHFEFKNWGWWSRTHDLEREQFAWEMLAKGIPLIRQACDLFRATFYNLPKNAT